MAPVRLPEPARLLLAAAPFVGLAAYHYRAWRADLAQADRPSREGSGPPATSGPSVTILVAAWNEAASIEAHVRSVRGLTYRPLSYVLCAGGGDGTYELAEAALGGWGTLLRQEPGEGKQAALRRAIAHADGDVVYLTDADCLLDDAAVGAVMACFVDGAVAVTGRSRPLESQLQDRPDVICQWAPHYVAETRLGDASGGFLGRNCALTRDLLRATGDFADDVATGTDYHLARRVAAIGRPIAFARRSFVATRMPEGVGAYVRQQRRWLRNHWVHGRGTDDRAAVGHAVRTWAIAWTLVLLPLLAALFGRWVLWPWSLLIAHGGLARARYVGFVGAAEQLAVDRRSYLLCPLWFVVDVVAWCLSLVDLLVPGLRRRW